MNLNQKLGQKQVLTVSDKRAHGIYLTAGEQNGRDGNVLLPRSQVPEGVDVGSSLEVFIYKDSEDRLIATIKEPKITLHKIGWLKVISDTKIGAFLDWGLDKDLLLPFREQPRRRVKEGQDVLVALYVDKSDRLCATTNIYPYLSTDSPYKEGDKVEGTLYRIGKPGAFVAVDDTYSAMIPIREYKSYKIDGHVCGEGGRVTAIVANVRDDGKLTLSIAKEDAAPEPGGTDMQPRETADAAYGQHVG